jgi:hypothetical protein
MRHGRREMLPNWTSITLVTAEGIRAASQGSARCLLPAQNSDTGLTRHMGRSNGCSPDAMGWSPPERLRVAFNTTSAKRTWIKLCSERWEQLQECKG